MNQKKWESAWLNSLLGGPPDQLFICCFVVVVVVVVVVAVVVVAVVVFVVLRVERLSFSGRVHVGGLLNQGKHQPTSCELLLEMKLMGH